MAPIFRMAKKSNTKRTVKFIAGCHDPRVQRILLQSANDSVYKAICNAFFNVAQNPDVSLSEKHKKRLKQFNPIIQKIISPRVPIKQKRRVIQKGGGLFLAAILPSVIGAALQFLGSTFLNKDK